MEEEAHSGSTNAVHSLSLPGKPEMKAAFWSFFGVLLWCYVAYPLLIRIRARWWPAPLARTSDSDTPRQVSVILTVRNEAHNLAARLNNLLAQDYPAYLVEILVICNGCTDSSEAIASRFSREHTSVRLLTSSAEDGKAGALNVGAEAARGEVLVFADARQKFDSGAISNLVKEFDDPSVGAVSGRLLLNGTNLPSLQGISSYWKWETNLRLAESRTGSVVGATGAIYAVRAELFQDLPPNLILDDVYLPLRIVQRGYRVILAADAIAIDRPSQDQLSEYARKVRTMVGNLQLLRVAPEFLSPVRNPLFTRYVSHKLLRLATPICLVGALLTGLMVGESMYQWMVAGQISFYAAGLIGLLLPLRLLSIPAAFVLAHGAVASALIRPHLDASSVWEDAPGRRDVAVDGP